MRRSRAAHRALAGQPQTAAAAAAAQDPAAVIRSFTVEANPTRPVRPSPLTASTIRDMPLDLVDRIRSFPLFNSAPEEFLLAIGQHLRPQVHATADHVIREGDDARAMYWLVRGRVAVTSRDGEAVYAELGPGSFFGEIAILMNIPRTASIVARTKCLLLSLKKEDLQAELPAFADMEKLIRDEAQERLTILKKKRAERSQAQHEARRRHHQQQEHQNHQSQSQNQSQSQQQQQQQQQQQTPNPKKRKSPSPSLVEDPSAGSVLGTAQVSIRTTLRELPLFSALPPDVLHHLALSAQPKTYSPFTDIVRQGTPGLEIYFVVRGEAEVIHDGPVSLPSTGPAPTDPAELRARKMSFYQRPRLRPGQYFGEVASLGLAHKRTATVRAITTVECLMIPGPALQELWRSSPPGLRQQVEHTAKMRFNMTADGDTIMTDVPAASIGGITGGIGGSTDVAEQFANFMFSASPAKSVSSVSAKSVSVKSGDESADARPTPDPDPFLSVDMENLRNRRKGSIAPPTPPADSSSSASAAAAAPPKPTHPLAMDPMTASTLPLAMTAAAADFSSSPEHVYSPPPDLEELPAKRARIQPARRSSAKQPVPDEVLELVFAAQLNIGELMQARTVCAHWKRILTTSRRVCRRVDLARFNRVVTDQLVAQVLAPFIGQRAEHIDISNCFHLTDVGFQALWKQCGQNVRCWKMRSVWDVSAGQMLEMSEHSKNIEEIDWSNCRKVGDNLLARVSGWVVPEMPPGMQPAPAPAPQRPAKGRGAKGKTQQPQRTVAMPPPGTVIGCPKLKRLDLSYCKHISDRSMAHLALHVSSRLERLTLTRCTTISDMGFNSWAQYRFTQLTHLCLADCTYLTDHAIAALVNAAKNLTHLDLSFCCALSDTSTEVVALGLPRLRELRLAFCGSAVSDGSLGCVALHLNELEGISVRGCVRVTGSGVESLLDGCTKLRWLDGSQCRNLEPWVRSGAVARYGHDERGGIGIPEGQAPQAMEVAEPSGPRLFVNRRELAPGRRERERDRVTFILSKSERGLR